MKHTYIPNFGPPGFTPDTVVEITSTGEVDPVAPALQRNTEKLGNVVDDAIRGYRSFAFDPAQEDKFYDKVEVLESVADSIVGASDSMPEGTLPYNSEKVEDAADSLIENRQAFAEACPTVAAVVPWAQMATAAQRLKKIGRRKDSLERRLENIKIFEAHTLTFLADTLTRAHEHSASVIDGNRVLSGTFKPLTTLVRGAAEQGQQTKRVVARAIKRQGQKMTAIVPVKDGAKDAAPPAAKDAPAKP